MSRPIIKHPTSEQLRQFGLGQLDADEQARIEEHIAHCEACCDSLQALPDDTLLANLKNCDTSIPETIDSTHFGRRKAAAQETGIPVELADHPRYRLVKVLGKGGMGVVYKAEHRLMQRPVALKVINHRLVRNATAIERFRLEVRAAAKLSHTNIVTAHDAEQAGNIHFLVMEYVEGTDLAKQVRKSGPLPVRHACHFVRQVACGLQQAFERGMVHRDIKPQNLMLTREGRVKILDFGLARLASEFDVDSEAAKLTKDGVTLGTPDYMAPEQILDSRQADIRADVYSLGCTLYYLLAGHPPFPDGSPVDKMTSHLNTAPPEIALQRTDLPTGVSEVIRRMLAKNVNERYQTPQEVADALRPFCASDAATPEAVLVAPPVPLKPAIDPLARPLATTPALHSNAYALKRDPNHVLRLIRKHRVPLITTGVALVLACLCIAAIDPIKRALKANDDNRSAMSTSFAPLQEAKSNATKPPAIGPVAQGSLPRVVIVLPRNQLWYPDYGEIVSAFGDRAEMVVASSRRGSIVASDGRTTMPASITLDQIDPARCDAIIFTGALEPARNMEFLQRDDYWHETHAAIEAMLRARKCVAALCAGNAVLAEHGVLDGKRAAWTEYIPPSYRTADISWQATNGVIAEGRVITATSSNEADGLAESILAAIKK